MFYVKMFNYRIGTCTVYGTEYVLIYINNSIQGGLMKKETIMLIEEGRYNEAYRIAVSLSDNYELDEADEILSEIYDRIIDEEGRNSSEAINYLNMLAHVKYLKGEYSASLSMYESVLDWYDENDMLDEAAAILVMSSISEIFELYNRFDDEYEICRKAFETSMASFGEEADVTCNSLDDLADCCVSLGEYDEALSYYEHLLCIYGDSEKENYEKIAKVYDGMGYAYRYKGMPLKSKECFENGIACIKRNTDEDSEALLMLLNDLCSLYDLLNMFDEALELRKSIYERAQKYYGFEHLNVEVSKSNLASAYSDSGDYDTAIEMYEECLSWIAERLGSEHREATRNKRCLSKAYLKVGKYEEALNLSEEVYRTYCKQMGEEHIDSVIALEEVAFCYIEMKNYRFAKEIFERTRKYFKDRYGENTDYYFSSENYLYACALSGEYDGVIGEADRIIELNNSFEEPSLIDDILQIKAITYRGLGMLEEAKDYQKKYIDAYTKKRGEYHPDTLAGKYELAYILFDKKEFNDAFDLCSETLSLQKEKKATYIGIAKSSTLLARIYSAIGDCDKADEILEGLLDEKPLQKFRAEYSDVCYAAAENYCSMNEIEKAKAFAEKSLELRRSVYEEENAAVKESVKLCRELNA